MTKSVLARGYGETFRFFNHFFVFFLAIFFCLAVNSAKAETRILALGDSLTAGYGLSKQDAFTSQLEQALKSTGKDVTVINAGVSGDTTAGGLSRVGWLMAEKPDAVIITLGGNDGLRGISPAESRKNLEKIILKFKKAKIPVLLSGMLAPPNLGRDYSEEFNQMYGQLAQRYRTLFFPFFLEDVATKSVYNQSDGIHPNKEGVQMIVKNIMPYVEKLLTQVK